MSLLTDLSNDAASLAEQAAPRIVAVRGANGRSSSGFIWRTGLVVTAEEALEGEDDAEVLLADATVAEFVQAHGRVPGSELVVLALGRLGGRALTHASDLDLIYLFTGDHLAESDGPRPLGATTYYNRLAQRVTVAMSVPTAAGKLYDVDTRLRPQGAQGPLVVTLDTPQLGWRPRDLDRAFLPFIHGMGIAQYTSDPVFRRLAAARPAERSDARVTPAAIGTLLGLRRRGVSRAEVQTFLDVFSRADLTWDHLAWLRARTTLPILLKGIQHPDDARRALDAGMDGVWVSNHAGRQVDGAIASLDALPRVAEAVAGRAPIVFDSGVRGGADVLRALALGATAVAVAHPWIYGMAIAGEQGAHDALRNVLAELDLSLGLSGHRTIADLSPAALSSS